MNLEKSICIKDLLNLLSLFSDLISLKMVSIWDVGASFTFVSFLVESSFLRMRESPKLMLSLSLLNPTLKFTFLRHLGQFLQTSLPSILQMEQLLHLILSHLKTSSVQFFCEKLCVLVCFRCQITIIVRRINDLLKGNEV